MLCFCLRVGEVVAWFIISKSLGCISISDFGGLFHVVWGGCTVDPSFFLGFSRL